MLIGNPLEESFRSICLWWIRFLLFAPNKWKAVAVDPAPKPPIYSFHRERGSEGEKQERRESTTSHGFSHNSPHLLLPSPPPFPPTQAPFSQTPPFPSPSPPPPPLLPRLVSTTTTITISSVDVSKEDTPLSPSENTDTTTTTTTTTTPPPGDAENAGVKSEPKLDPRRVEEKFAVLNTGIYECRSCGYRYDEAAGDPSYPVPPASSSPSSPTTGAARPAAPPAPSSRARASRSPASRRTSSSASAPTPSPPARRPSSSTAASSSASSSSSQVTSCNDQSNLFTTPA
uniref:Rubredoxin domain-containing protein n=1 Tax=Ananas comosus var. bracteatus TaxID=296719 RepID=A0A6V7PC07_ANACO|nr:unnamed protein product [Ananas comosus var. bracteatus]